MKTPFVTKGALAGTNKEKAVIYRGKFRLAFIWTIYQNINIKKDISLYRGGKEVE